MPNSTTNYAFNLPLVNDAIDADLWGTQLNSNWTSIDTLLGATGGIPDNQFRVRGSVDNTKRLAIEVDGLTTGTTRTLTVRDADGILPVIQTADLAIPATSAGPSSITLAEDTDNGTNTVQIIAPAAVTSNRVLTLPDATGEIISSARTASDTVTGVVELATTAEVQAGTDTTRAVTPKGFADSSLGLAQTYQNVTGSRAYGTTYTNNTGRPIFVVVQGTAGGGGQITATVGGVAVLIASAGSSAGSIPVGSFIVPNNMTYVVTGTTSLSTWYELR